MCGTRLAENAGPKKLPKTAIWAPSHNFVKLYLHNQGTCRQSEKNLSSSNMSSRCPHNMVNIGPLTAENDWQVWGISSYFSRYHVLAALLHGSQVVGVSQTAALNRGRHLCSAGRPSHWALAHILVLHYFAKFVYNVVVKQLLGLPRFQPVTILIRSVQLFSDCLGETREGNMLYFRL